LLETAQVRLVNALAARTGCADNDERPDMSANATKKESAPRPTARQLIIRLRTSRTSAHHAKSGQGWRPLRMPVITTEPVAPATAQRQPTGTTLLCI
jgi:hypothetical protein